MASTKQQTDRMAVGTKYRLTIHEECARLPVLYLGQEGEEHRFVYRNSEQQPKLVLVLDADINEIRGSNIIARASSKRIYGDDGLDKQLKGAEI